MSEINQLIINEKKRIISLIDQPNIESIIKQSISSLKSHKDVDSGIDDKGNDIKDVSRIKFNNYCYVVFYQEWATRILETRVKK